MAWSLFGSNPRSKVLLTYHELYRRSDKNPVKMQMLSFTEMFLTFVFFIVLNILLHWETNWEDNKNKISISGYWMTHVSHDIINAIYHSFENNVSLTHWGRATYICVGKLTIIGSDNGLSPGRRQAIIWTIAGILLIGPLGTNFSEILIGIQTFSFKKMNLKMSSAKWRPFVSASMR